ncbi:hypothetical protein [Paraburkholderia sediminicola]|uniref:hypothetical protein n=1 Tax=Paraburkholderia sediminicola TaxID=458836 RepID=UPI0038BD929F
MAPPRKDSEKSEIEAGVQAAYAVARGRTVKVDGKSFGPGQPVNPPDDDIPHLLKIGFIVSVDAEGDVPAAGIRVGGLQIRGGTRPGASVA